MSSRDEKLAELLDRLTHPGDQPSGVMVDQLATEHPDLAGELRELWATAQIAHAVGDLSATEQFESDHRERSLDNSERELNVQEFPPSLPDYELLEELGRGGMGVVYKARQKSLDRLVAIKFILAGSHAPLEERERFQAEAMAAAQLQHPQIVPIYEVGQHQDHLFFTMQLFEGETLSSRLLDGPLPELEAAQIVLKLARAIDYAHRSGVIHRDLKPSNILLDDEGQPHITDFGLAKRLSDGPSLTRTGAVLGTPSYMAPEQATGGLGEVGPSCDIYSLGTILYALVTGRPPFQGPSPVDTVLMLLDQEPLPPRLLSRQVNRDLEMIILRCLQKPQELRYSSAESLAEDLDAYLSGEPVSARSGHFSHVVTRLFRDTHHAAVLQNWGLLWMWHAVVLLCICLVTNWFHALRTSLPIMNTPGPYLLLWGGALAIWAPTFWRLRHRAGPVTAVERQIAHVWGASIAAVMLLFVTESILGLPVLTLSPVLGLVSGMVFTVKAGILTGTFYFHAAALYATCLAMAWMQRVGIEYGITFYGFVSAATFFFPGWKYYRQSTQEGQSEQRAPTSRSEFSKSR